jgi:hypothetical protein
MQDRMVEVNLAPLEIDNLGRAQPMTVGDNDHSGVAPALAVGSGSLDQLVHFHRR